MAQRIENARQKLMERGRICLLGTETGQYGRLGIRELTADCGIALGTFYRYFKSKDDLVLQILKEDWDKMLARLDELMLADLSLYEKIRGMYEVVSDYERGYRYSAMQLFSANEENLAFREENMLRLYERIKALLKSEIDRGSLVLTADLDSAAYLLVELIIATAKNPRMDFDDLWRCMIFQDNSGLPGGTVLA